MASAVAQPLPGYGIKPNPVPPQPGQVVVSYMVVEPETGCCKCDDLTGGGLALLIIGILFFWPIALIPCFMAEFKEKKQMPQYGYPAGVVPVEAVQQPAAVIGMPTGKTA